MNVYYILEINLLPILLVIALDLVEMEIQNKLALTILVTVVRIYIAKYWVNYIHVVAVN